MRESSKMSSTENEKCDKLKKRKKLSGSENRIQRDKRKLADLAKHNTKLTNFWTRGKYFCFVYSGFHSSGYFVFMIGFQFHLLSEIIEICKLVDKPDFHAKFMTIY